MTRTPRWIALALLLPACQLFPDPGPSAQYPCASAADCPGGTCACLCVGAQTYGWVASAADCSGGTCVASFCSSSDAGCCGGPSGTSSSADNTTGGGSGSGSGSGTTGSGTSSGGAAAFAGSWSGQATITAGGQSQSVSASETVVAQGQSNITFEYYLGLDGCTLPMSVTGSIATLQGPVTCDSPGYPWQFSAGGAQLGSGHTMSVSVSGTETPGNPITFQVQETLQ